MKSVLLLLLALLSAGPLHFDKTVHDHGTVSTKDGPLTCTFTLTNDSEEPLLIYTVISTCDCTHAVWTREGIAPGKSGEITVTYDNTDPFSFDKRLSVYTSAQKKPYILHVKGRMKK